MNIFRFISIKQFFILCLFQFIQLRSINGSGNQLEISNYDVNGNFKFTPRVIGGRKANNGEFRSIVSIQWQGEHFCGGTWFQVGNKSHILTAAHCTVDTKNRPLSKHFLQVMGNDLSISSSSGSSRRQIRKISKIVTHPYFKPDNLYNDMAILFLTSPFDETSTFAPISLANRSINDYQDCTIAGWGYLDEWQSKTYELMIANVSVIPRKICNGIFAYNGLVSRHAFCAGSVSGDRDTCQGDSGGGIVSNNRVIGVVSSGYGCGRRNFPGIYTNVYHYNHWIRQVINSSSTFTFSRVLMLVALTITLSTFAV